MNGISEKLREFLVKEPLILEHLIDDVERIETKQDNLLEKIIDIGTELKLLRQNEKYQTRQIENQGLKLSTILKYVIIIASAVGSGSLITQFAM